MSEIRFSLTRNHALCVFIVPLFAVCFAMTLCAQNARVAFIRNGQLYTADGNGSSARQWTTERSEKRMPQWSPDGKKIVYFDPARSSKAFGNLVVVDTSGLPVEKYAVATEDEHGIPIGGMRAVEDIGWFDRENLFAAGSVNPYISEFKTINTNSRKVAGFGGTGFSTCKQSGVVAFWQPVFPQTKSFSLETSNSGLSLFEFPDKDQLPTLGISTRWSNTCTAVAFIDPMPPRHLVVVSLNRDSRVILLPGEIKSDALRAVPEGFLLGEAGELLYREAASTLINTPAEILQRIQRVSESRKKVEKLLGVDDAAWYGGADDR